MPVKYYVGEDAVRFLHDLASGRFIAIVTDEVRRILGRDIPSRSFLGEPEVIVDVYRNPRGEVVVAVIPRDDERAFGALPLDSQERIYRELQKPEWGATATLARGFLKSLPSAAFEMGLRTLGGLLAGPHGAVVGVTSGALRGGAKAWQFWKIYRNAVRARRILRAVPFLRKMPGVLRASGHPAVVHGLTEVLPNIAGWVSQEVYQLGAQPPEVRRGYLPAGIVGAGQGVFDVVLRRYLPPKGVAGAVKWVFEHPVIGTAAHGTLGMGAYSALQRWVSGRDIDVGEVLTEAVPTGLMGAALPASIWAAGKLGRWLRRRLPFPSLRTVYELKEPKWRPSFPPSQIPIPKKHPHAPLQPMPGGIEREMPALQWRPKPAQIPSDVPLKPWELASTAVASKIKAKHQATIDALIDGSPPWVAAWLMDVLGIDDINELRASGADRSMELLKNAVASGTKYTRKDADNFIFELLGEGRRRTQNLKVEDEGAAYAHLNRVLGIMESRGEFVTGPFELLGGKKFYPQPLTAASDEVRQGYLQEVGALAGPPDNLQPRGILDRRANYIAQRIVEIVRRSGDHKAQAALMRAFGARSFADAQVRIAEYIKKRYNRLVRAHGIADDHVVLYEITNRIKNVRDRIDRLPPSKKVDISNIEADIVSFSVLGMGKDVVDAIAAALGIADLRILQKSLAAEYQRMKKTYGPNARQEFDRWINRLIALGKARLGKDVQAKYEGPAVDALLDKIKAAAEKWGRGEELSDEEKELLSGYVLTRDSEGNVIVRFADREAPVSDVGIAPVPPVGGAEEAAPAPPVGGVEEVAPAPPAGGAEVAETETVGVRLDEFVRKRRQRKMGIQEAPEGVEPTEAAPTTEPAADEGKISGVENVDDTTPLPSEEAFSPKPPTRKSKRLKYQRDFRTVVGIDPENPHAVGNVVVGKDESGADFVEITPTLTAHNVVYFVDIAKGLIRTALDTLIGRRLIVTPYGMRMLDENARQIITYGIIDDIAAAMQLVYQLSAWGNLESVPVVRLTMQENPGIGSYTRMEGVGVIEISIPSYVKTYAPIFLAGPKELARYIVTGSYPVMLHEITHGLVDKLYQNTPDFRVELMNWYTAIRKWAEEAAADESRKDHNLAKTILKIINEYEKEFQMLREGEFGQAAQKVRRKATKESIKQAMDIYVARELFTRFATLELAATYPDEPFWKLDQINALNVVPFLNATAVIANVRSLDFAGHFTEAERLFEKYFKPLLMPPRPLTLDERIVEAERKGLVDLAERLHFTETTGFGEEIEERYWEEVDWEEMGKAIAGEGYEGDIIGELFDKKEWYEIADFLIGTKSIKRSKKSFPAVVKKLEGLIRKLAGELTEHRRKFLGKVYIPEGEQTKVLSFPEAPVTWEEFVQAYWWAERGPYIKRLMKRGTSEAVKKLRAAEARIESIPEEQQPLRDLLEERAGKYRSSVEAEAYRRWLARNEERLRQEYLAELEKSAISRVIIPTSVAQQEQAEIMRTALKLTQQIHFLKRLLENLREKQLAELSGEKGRRLEDVKFVAEQEWFIPAGITYIGMQDVFSSTTTTDARMIGSNLKEVYVGYSLPYRRFIVAVDLFAEQNVAPIEKRAISPTDVGIERRLAFTEDIPYKFLSDEELGNFHRYSHHFPVTMVYMPEGLDPAFFNAENRGKAARYVASSLEVLLRTDPKKDRVLRDIAIARLFEFAKAVFAQKARISPTEEDTYIDVLRREILQTRRWSVEHYDLHAKVNNFVAFLLENAEKLLNIHAYLGGDRDIFDAIHLLLTYYQNYLIRPSDLGAPINFVRKIRRAIKAWRDAVVMRSHDPEFKELYDLPAKDKALRNRLQNWFSFIMNPFINPQDKRSEYMISFADGRKAFQYIASQVPLKTLQDIYGNLKKLYDIYTTWTDAPRDEALINSSHLSDIENNIKQIDTLIKQKAPREDIEALTLDTLMLAFEFMIENPVLLKADWGMWGDEASKVFKRVASTLDLYMKAFLLGYLYTREAATFTRYVPFPYNFQAIMFARYMERVRRMALNKNESLSKALQGFYPPDFWTEKDITAIAHGVSDENMQVIELEIRRGGPKRKKPIARAKLLPASEGRKINPGMYYFYIHNYPDQFLNALRDWLKQHPDKTVEPSDAAATNYQPDFVLAALFYGVDLSVDEINRVSAQAAEVWDRFRKLFARAFDDTTDPYVSGASQWWLEMVDGERVPNRYAKNKDYVAASLMSEFTNFAKLVWGYTPEELEGIPIDHVMRMDIRKQLETMAPSDFVAFLEYFHYTRGSFSATVPKGSRFPKVMSLRGSAALTIKEIFGILERILPDANRKELYDLYNHPGFPWFAYTLELMLVHARKNAEDPVLANAFRRIDDDVEPPLSYHELVERRYKMIEGQESVEVDDEMSDAVETLEDAIVEPEILDDFEGTEKRYVPEIENFSDALATELGRRNIPLIEGDNVLDVYETMQDPQNAQEYAINNFDKWQKLVKVLFVAEDSKIRGELSEGFDVLEVPLRILRITEGFRELILRTKEIDQLLEENKVDEATELMMELIQIADSPGGFISYVFNTEGNSASLAQQVNILRNTRGSIVADVVRGRIPEIARASIEKAEAEFLRASPRSTVTFAEPEFGRIAPDSRVGAALYESEAVRLWGDWYKGVMLLAGLGKGKDGLKNLVSDLIEISESLYDKVDEYIKILDQKNRAEEIVEIEKALASSDYTSPTTEMELEKAPIVKDTAGNLIIDTIENVANAFDEQVVNPLMASDWLVVDEATQEVNWVETERAVKGAVIEFTKLIKSVAQANQRAVARGEQPTSIVSVPEFIPKAKAALSAIKWVVDMSSRIFDYFDDVIIMNTLMQHKDIAREMWGEVVHPIYRMFWTLMKDHFPVIDKMLAEVAPHIESLKSQVEAGAEGASEIASQLQELHVVYDGLFRAITEANGIGRDFYRLRKKIYPKPQPQRVDPSIPPSKEEVFHGKPIALEGMLENARSHITSNANAVLMRINQLAGNIYKSIKKLSPIVGDYIEHVVHHLNDVTYKYKTKFFNVLDRSIKLTDELKKRYPQHARFAHIDIAIALAGMHPLQPNSAQRQQEFNRHTEGMILLYDKYAGKRTNPAVKAGENMRLFWDKQAYKGLIAGKHALIISRIQALSNDPDYAKDVLNVAAAYRVAGDMMHAEAKAHRIGIKPKKRGAIAEVVDYVEDYYPFIPSDGGAQLLWMMHDIFDKLEKEDWADLGQVAPALASEELFKRLKTMREKPASFQHQIEFRRNLPWGWLFLMSDLNPATAWLRYAQGLASLVGEYEALNTFAGMLRQNPGHYGFFKQTLEFLNEWAQKNPDVAPPPDQMWDRIIVDAVNSGIDNETIGVGGYMDPANAKVQLITFVNILHGTYNPTNLNEYRRPAVLKEYFEGIKAINDALSKQGLTADNIAFLLPLLTTKTGQAQYGRLLHTLEKSAPGLWNAMSALTSFAVMTAFSFRTALVNLPEGIALSMGMALAKDGTFVGQLKDNLKMAWNMLKGLGVAVQKVFNKEFIDFYRNLLRNKVDPKVIDEFLEDETVRVILSRFIGTMYAGAMGRSLTQALPEWWLHWATFFNLAEMFTLVKSAAALKAYLEDKAPIFKKVLAGTASPEEEAYVNRLLMHWNFGDVERFKFIAAQEAQKHGIDPKDVDKIWEKVRSYITYRGVFELHHEYGAWDMPELWHSNPFVNRAFYWIRSFSIQQANKFLHHFITSKHKSLPAKTASALAMMLAYGMVIYPVMQMIYSVVTGDYDEAPADLFSPVTWKGAIFNTIADMLGNPTSPLGIYGDAAAILEYAARSRSPMGAVRSVVSPLANMVVDVIWGAFQTAMGLVTEDPYAFEKAKETTERLIPMRSVFGKLIPHAMEKLGVEFPAASTTSRKLSAQLLRAFPMTKNWITDQPHHNWQTKILPLLAQGDAHKLAHLIVQTRPGVIYDALTKGEKLTPTQYAKLLDAIEPVMRRFDPQEYERFVQMKPYLIQWANEQAAIQKQSAVINSAPILAVLEKYMFELLSELPDDLRNAVINHLIIGAVERGMQPSSLKAPSIPDIPVEAVVNTAAVGDVPKLRILGSAAAFMGRALFREALKANTGIDDKTAEIFLHKLYSAVEEREDAWTVVDRATAHSAYYRAFKYTADALATVFDYVFPHMTHPRLKDYAGRIRQNIGIRLNSHYKTYADVFPPAIAMRKAWDDTMQDPEIIDRIIALGDAIRMVQQPRLIFFRRLLQGEKIQREPVVAYDYLIDANWFNILGRGERMKQRMARAGEVSFAEDSYMLPSFLR